MLVAIKLLGRKMTYEPASPSGLSKAQVFDLAEKFARNLGYHPGADLTDLINRIGGKIAYADTLLVDPNRSGSLFVEAPDNFKIILPAHTGVARDKFTVAHELGHYVLHYLCNKKRNNPQMMALRRGSDRLEWEANWFAAAFLMSTTAFRARYHRKNGNLSDIAEFFGVSEKAAQIRAKDIGLQL